MVATWSQVQGLSSFWILLCIFGMNALAAEFFPSSVRGEGCVTGMGDTGAVCFQTAKVHAVEPQKAYEPSPSTRRATLKRSFRRAQRRAALHGYTWYRGRLCTATHLGTSCSDLAQDPIITQNVAPKLSRRRQRLTVFNWNCSGLAPYKWDQLQQWLDHQCIDVLSVQETHWSYTTEWLQSKYCAIHSGDHSNAGGILFLISRQLCAQHDISWAEIIPGRLLHVRIHGQKRHIDLISVYQHIHRSDRLEQRQDVWNQLDTVLTSLSTRHTLLLMGDFNTSLQRRSNAIGVKDYLHQGDRCLGPPHRDQHLLHNLIQTFDLTALNTWSHSLGPTYQFDHQHSRIDFIFCRRHFSDKTSKQVQYLYDFNLNNLHGAMHFPMICSVLKVWHQHPHAQPLGWSRAARLDLCQFWCQPSSST